jgi:hypothetical protein
MKRLGTALSALRGALDGARRDLDTLQDKISDLKDKRAQIEGAPADRATIERRVDALIDRTLAGRDMHFPVLSAATEHPFGAFEVNQRFQQGGTFAMLCAFDRVGMREALLAQMPTSGISAEERVSKLSKINAELLSLEMAEEATLREIEATGATMPRRADANPEILLAPTDELGG